MEKYLIYFPVNYEFTNYDQNFAKALNSMSIETDVYTSLDRHGEYILHNAETLYLHPGFKEFIDRKREEKSARKVTKYFCGRCNTIIEVKRAIREMRKDVKTIGYIKEDNKFLLLPTMARIFFPERWLRVEGKNSVYYIDRETYRIIKGFIKKGAETPFEIVDIAFPALKNVMVQNPSYFKTFEIRNYAPIYHCPICNSILKKEMYFPVISGKTTLAYYNDDGVYYFEDGGVIRMLSDSNGTTRIIVPKEFSHLSHVAEGTENVSLSTYKGIRNHGNVVKKLASKLRNMNQIGGKENEDLDIIALKYVESLKSEVSEMIKKGDYIDALKKFYSGTSTFDKFFIQGGRRRIGIPRKGIRELIYSFEAFFNGSGEHLFFSGIHLEEEWWNLIDLYLKVERAKTKDGGRRHSYEQIVISTVAPLPPETYIKNFLNVDEIMIITGIWHGVKFVVTPNREKIGQYYKNYASKLSYILSKKEAKDIIKKIESGEYYVGVEGQNLRITREMVNIVPQVSEGYAKGKFRIGEFYLKTTHDKCTMETNDLIRKINYEREKLKMNREDPVDVVVKEDECRDRIDAKYNIIAEKTNLRKLSFGDDFSITPFYKTSLLRSLENYLDITNEQARKILDDGIENLYVLQVGDIVSLPIHETEIRGKIIEARKKVISPRNEVDVVKCSLCEGKVANDVCEECGFHY